VGLLKVNCAIRKLFPYALSQVDGEELGLLPDFRPMNETLALKF